MTNDNTKPWITRREAARRLGACEQTISNYAERGLLHFKKTGQIYLFPSEEIEQMAAIPEVVEIEKMRQAIEADYAEIKETRDKVARQKENARVAFLMAFGSRVKWGRYKEVVKATVEALFADDERFTARNKAIILDVLDGYGVEEVADKYDLTFQRVRGIIMTVLFKMRRYPKYREDKIANLELYIASQDREIESLKKEVSRLRGLEAIGEIGAGNGDRTKVVRHLWPFNLDLTTPGLLSVRAINCCRALDINTIADLALSPRTKLVRCRNMGVKSMREIDALLSKYGLTYGMEENVQ